MAHPWKMKFAPNLGLTSLDTPTFRHSARSTDPIDQIDYIADLGLPELSGTASGLSGFLGTLVAAAATQAVGNLSDGTPVPVLVGMAMLAAASLGAAVIAFRPGH